MGRRRGIKDARVIRLEKKTEGRSNLKEVLESLKEGQFQGNEKGKFRGETNESIAYLQKLNTDPARGGDSNGEEMQEKKENRGKKFKVVLKRGGGRLWDSRLMQERGGESCWNSSFGVGVMSWAGMGRGAKMWAKGGEEGHLRVLGGGNRGYFIDL